MKLGEKIKNLIAIIILGLGILAALFFVARPLAASSLNIYKTNKDKKAEISSVDQNIQNLESIKAELENVRYTIEKAQNFISDNPDINDFIVQLEAAAKKKNVTLTSINFGEDKEPVQDTSQSSEPAQDANQTQETQKTESKKIINISGIEETIFEAQVTGKYPDFINFLKQMKNLARFNIIKNISIESDEEGVVTATFFIIIFSTNL